MGRSQRVVVEGKQSQEAPVTSGVPQGSVLGPILFLIYINDLPEGVKSEVRLFADDTIMYRPISNPQDSLALQEDLDKLIEWEQDWLKEFHPGKCQVIRVTRSKKPITSDYYLHGHKLETVDSAKYLGVTLNQDLSWNNHIHQVTTKANRALWAVKRNLKINSPTIKTVAYNTLVRPILEYSAAIWDPYTQANVHRVEMVQRRAARWTLNRYHNTSSVTSMLKQLQWMPLQCRRSETRLCLMPYVQNGTWTSGHQYRPLRNTRPKTHSKYASS
jgi:hypothetical protein